jgi:DNA mismatch repair protein MutS2
VQDIYEKLEFQRIREEISLLCRTEVGKNKAESLKMLDEITLDGELARLREMDSIYVRYGRLPIDVSSSLEQTVELAKKGGTLSVEDLERVAHDVKQGESLINFFRQVTDSPLLIGYASRFPTLSFLEKDIHKIIAPDLSIYDGASPKLRGVRAAIKKLEDSMKKKLGFILDQNKIYLSDTTLTIKNGHYVLPVANSYKNKVKGIIQDVSNTGETTFIEPELIVELNNQMVELRNDEREEIRRLLHELSQEVAGSGDAVKELNAMIGYLDFLMAKSLYEEKTIGHVARLIKEPTVDLTNARHPLIDPAKVVPNDFSLSGKTRLVVISGPNAGGKTVALKTLGLAILMNECGLPVLADEGVTLSYFPHLYCDIGDSQSLSDNLSTFSGHMENIGEILSSVGGRDLVLLDEVGTGTSPKEGEAIAYAVIETLLRKHAITLISSHFEGLKAYALSNPEVTNASMMFDEANLVPTYKLKMGLPGESYGLIVAERFGLPKETLAFAKDYLSKHEEASVSEAIKKLSEVTRLTEIEKDKALSKEKELDQKSTQLANKEAQLAKREANYLSDVEDKKNQILEGYERQMEDILSSVSGREAKMHEVIAAKKKLDDLKEVASEETFSGPVAVGDYVNIPSAYVTGRVTSIQGEKIEIATREGMTFKTKLNKVVKTSEPPAEKEVHTTGVQLDDLAKQKSLPLELNLIGQHVDEAELNLDSYLDKCRLKGFKRVRIIHGWGSGALRNLVRDYLDDHKDFVDHYEAAGEYEGGGGATVVYLK